jgi:peptidoglycan/LPS O-acetylase OafA/YrhL
LPYGFGSVAVTVFFALSGFVISEAVDQVYQGRPISFFSNRMLRIVPHLLLAVGVAVLLCYSFSAHGMLRLAHHEHLDPRTAFSVRNLAANFFAFVPASERFMQFNFLVPAWALRVEVLFYALVVVAMTLSRLISRRGGAVPGALGVGLGLAIVVAPLSVMAGLGKAPEMFQFAPYFVYGAALYVIVRSRSPIAFVVAGVSLAGIIFQFMSLPSHNEAFGFERAVGAEFAMLLALLGLMTALAFMRFPGFRRLDRSLGDMTYVLYISHPNVLILVLSVTSDFSYAGLAAGLALSVLVTHVSRALVDPLVDGLRDSVRGQLLGGRPAFLQRPLVSQEGLER